MKTLSTICLILGAVCLVLGAISTRGVMLMGARTWATGSGLFLLLSIAINTQK
ncbi:MAG: hypothetical protein KJ967_01925 [Elusimicrobia bacterium]|nr:hypothetical protein [Elusimicrobiota bacterium]